MPGQLQVRQGIVAQLSEAGMVVSITWSRWCDVESPGWLVGYMLPHEPFVYELRHAPDPPDPDVPF